MYIYHDFLFGLQFPLEVRELHASRLVFPSSRGYFARSTCEREERPVATTFFTLQALGPPLTVERSTCSLVQLMEREASPLLPTHTRPRNPRRPSLPRLQTSLHVQWRVPPPPPTPLPPRLRVRSLDLVRPLMPRQQLTGNVGAWRVTVYHADREYVCLRRVQSTPPFALSHQPDHVCRRTPSPSQESQSAG